MSRLVDRLLLPLLKLVLAESDRLLVAGADSSTGSLACVVSGLASGNALGITSDALVLDSLLGLLVLPGSSPLALLAHALALVGPSCSGGHVPHVAIINSTIGSVGRHRGTAVPFTLAGKEDGGVSTPSDIFDFSFRLEELFFFKLLFLVLILLFLLILINIVDVVDLILIAEVIKVDLIDVVDLDGLTDLAKFWDLSDLADFAGDEGSSWGGHWGSSNHRGDGDQEESGQLGGELHDEKNEEQMSVLKECGG